MARLWGLGPPADDSEPLNFSPSSRNRLPLFLKPSRHPCRALAGEAVVDVLTQGPGVLLRLNASPKGFCSDSQVSCPQHDAVLLEKLQAKCGHKLALIKHLPN